MSKFKTGTIITFQSEAEAIGFLIGMNYERKKVVKFSDADIVKLKNRGLADFESGNQFCSIIDSYEGISLAKLSDEEYVFMNEKKSFFFLGSLAAFFEEIKRKGYKFDKIVRNN